MSQSYPVPGNLLLKALPNSEYDRLIPYLENISLFSGQILYPANEPIEFVFFPNQAIISLVTSMEDGSTTEIGLVGNEGMAGISIILGDNSSNSEAIVQIENSAMRLPADVLKREFDRGQNLQKLLLLYTHALLVQVSQTAACNRRHTIEQRLARWLLAIRDCVEKDELLITQEFIANMLGVRRAGVTVALGSLQKAEIVRSTRGKITILDRLGLSARACECYRVIRDRYRHLHNFMVG